MSSSSSSIDLRNRILFTIGILAVYRFGTFVPLPGIDPEQLKVLMEGNMSAEEVAKKAINVAADICVFTNDNVKIEKI